MKKKNNSGHPVTLQWFSIEIHKSESWRLDQLMQNAYYNQTKESLLLTKKIEKVIQCWTRYFLNIRAFLGREEVSGPPLRLEVVGPPSNLTQVDRHWKVLGSWKTLIKVISLSQMIIVHSQKRQSVATIFGNINDHFGRTWFLWDWECHSIRIVLNLAKFKNYH